MDSTCKEEILHLNKYRSQIREVKNLPPWIVLKKRGDDVTFSRWWTTDENFEFEESDKKVIYPLVKGLKDSLEFEIKLDLGVVDSDVCLSISLKDNSTFFMKYSDSKLYIIENTVPDSKYYEKVMEVIIKYVQEMKFTEFELMCG